MHNSIIAAGNGGGIPIKAQFTLYYDSGRKRYDLEQALKPHEQMLVDVGKLIRERVPDKSGSLLPTDLTMGSYEIQDLTDRGVGNLYEGKVIVDKTYGHAAYGCATCCGFGDSPFMVYDPLGVGLDATTTQGVSDIDFCTGGDVSVTEFFPDANWDTADHAIATASGPNVKGVAIGTTPLTTTGTITIGNANAFRCPQVQASPSAPTNVEPVPSGEITELDGTILITQGQFLMTLEPGTYSYDGNTVTESSPVPGSNACWWSSSGMAQYPTVQGSTWTVAAGQGVDAGHNQYGLDTTGFESGVVNLIQTQGPAHDVELPCEVDVYQSMNYEGIDLYVTNLQLQTIGSNTVQTCRAGVCTSTIPF